MNKIPQSKHGIYRVSSESENSRLKQSQTVNEALTQTILGVLLKTAPEIRATIDLLIENASEQKPQRLTGPLLLSMGAAASYLGVSRSTLWRLIGTGVLPKFELLPGTFRVRRVDIEHFVGTTE